MPGVIRRDTAIAARPFSLADVEARAGEMLRAARARADEIVREAHTRAETEARDIRREAQQRGYADGRAEGLAALDEESRRAAAATAEADMRTLLEALGASLRAFDAAKQHMLAAAESGLIELAYAIARRVCKTLPERSTAPAELNARCVLEMARAEHDVRLHVHPAEFERLKELAAEWVAQISHLAHVEVVADASVSRGGCVLRGRQATIDAGIDTQLERVARALLHDGSNESAENELRSDRGTSNAAP